MARYPQAPTEARPGSRNLRVLAQLFAFLRPYRKRLLLAAVALVLAAGSLLGFGVVLRGMVDYGLGGGSVQALNRALAGFLVIVSVMAVSVAARA